MQKRIRIVVCCCRLKMPQRRLQELRKEKQAKRSAARAATAASQQLLDTALPSSDFTADRAAAADINQLYVDPDEEAPQSDGPLTNDLLTASVHLRERGEDWLSRLAKRLPDKDEWSLTGNGVSAASAAAEQMRTAEYVQARCQSWVWRADMLTRPLCLFDSVNASTEMEQSALMDSQAYLHAEMELCQHELGKTAEAEAIGDWASALASRLQPYYTRVLLDGQPVDATAAQHTPVHFKSAFWLDSATQRLFLLCTLVDPESFSVVAHFYIPRLTTTAAARTLK